jgi:hypothetical protein
MAFSHPGLDGNETNPSIEDGGYIAPTTVQEDQKAKRQAIRKVFDENMKNRPVKHDAAHVLLLSWDDTLDDVGVQTEVGQYLVNERPDHITDACM